MALPGNKNFSDYDNYITDQNPTTAAQAQDYFRNQAELLKAVIDCDFWQPETVYQPGDVVKSDSMPNGTEAVMVATKASVTSNVEPQWGAVGGANISDGACFWKLRWKHWSKEVATQSQAEKGTDNVTVVTPLRTKQAIDKQRPIKTYTSLAELGLSNDATEADVFNAMGVNAELAFSFYQNSYPNFTLLNTIKKDGFIKFSSASNRNLMLFMPSNEKYCYVGNVFQGNVIWDMFSSASEHQIKTFTSLEQLGLDDTATEGDVLNAMPPHSKLAILFEMARYKNFVLGRYGGDGFAVFEKADHNIRSSIYFQPTNERRIITGSYFNNKLIYAVRYPNGNMPFENKINIEVSNNGVTTYLCPSSGWVYVQVSTNSVYSSLRVQNATKDYSVMTPNARSNTLISIMLPCAVADTIEIYIEASTVIKAYFFSNLDEWGEYSV